ncbi:hypothetical protein Tdes44962_MAKER00637 [Teratosphaeria destructans]|uniref:Uncharacterized protein n=1 Tax=Teratosphaeria destructans TaxID=418781 RepID=A0A9W7SND2_9PEZI|nr:hypothetical protein Tdes44962_MAKER00637 [Teratosphaeria destructans]
MALDDQQLPHLYPVDAGNPHAYNGIRPQEIDMPRNGVLTCLLAKLLVSERSKTGPDAFLAVSV